MAQQCSKCGADIPDKWEAPMNQAIKDDMIPKSLCPKCYIEDGQDFLKKLKKGKIWTIFKLIIMSFFAFSGIMTLISNPSDWFWALFTFGIGGIPSAIMRTYGRKTQSERHLQRLVDLHSADGGCLRMILEALGCILLGVIIVPFLFYKNISELKEITWMTNYINRNILLCQSIIDEDNNGGVSGK